MSDRLSRDIRHDAKEAEKKGPKNGVRMVHLDGFTVLFRVPFVERWRDLFFFYIWLPMHEGGNSSWPPPWLVEEWVGVVARMLECKIDFPRTGIEE